MTSKNSGKSSMPSHFRTTTYSCYFEVTEEMIKAAHQDYALRLYTHTLGQLCHLKMKGAKEKKNENSERKENSDRTGTTDMAVKPLRIQLSKKEEAVTKIRMVMEILETLMETKIITTILETWDSSMDK
ncbi:hypothetical protein G9A89_006368 [Geosiphon pyriformis]|nr:hypothetical protein G9A89_006368 [Geosiphon pyriformis]